MEKVLYGWTNSEVYLQPSGISMIELFMKLLTTKIRYLFPQKMFHHVVVAYTPGERFYFQLFL